MCEWVYMKGKDKVTRQESCLRVQDLAQIGCSRKELQLAVEALPVLTVSGEKKGEVVVSVLDMIRVIQQAYPDVRVVNLGQTEMLVSYGKGNSSRTACYGKAILAGLLLFFGAAFSIMTFHNDVNMPALFARLSQVVTGSKERGLGLLQGSYSFGLGVGVWLFFRGLGKPKQFPGPLEVETSQYEKNLHDATVEAMTQKEEDSVDR